MRSRLLYWNVLAAVALAIVPGLSLAQSPQRGDTIVRNAQAPRYPGVATLIEEMSIGVADGSEEYVLGRVSDIALGRDGSLYVFDGQVPVVRHYDASGKFVRRIGRSGSGPGEYRSVSGIATMPDGQLLVWDTGNWRVNVYAPNGDFVTQWTTPSGMSGGGTAQYSRALMVDAAGNIVMRKQIIRIREPGIHPTVWLRYRTDGTFIDTVHAPTGPESPLLVARAGNVSQSNPVPFSPIRIATYNPLGYIVAGFPNRYAVELHRPAGTTSIRRDVRPVSVSRAERSEARDDILRKMRGVDPNWSWSGPEIPDVKPSYFGLNVGLDGQLWVQLTQEGRDGPGVSGSVGMGGGMRSPPRAPDADPPKPSMYDIFDAEGGYLGQVQVPAGVSVMLRRGNQAWGYAIGDDDVPRIKRYRINWSR